MYACKLRTIILLRLAPQYYSILPNSLHINRLLWYLYMAIRVAAQSVTLSLNLTQGKRGLQDGRWDHFLCDCLSLTSNSVSELTLSISQSVCMSQESGNYSEETMTDSPSVSTSLSAMRRGWSLMTPSLSLFSRSVISVSDSGAGSPDERSMPESTWEGVELSRSSLDFDLFFFLYKVSSKNSHAAEMIIIAQGMVINFT